MPVFLWYFPLGRALGGKKKSSLYFKSNTGSVLPQSRMKCIQKLVGCSFQFSSYFSIYKVNVHLWKHLIPRPHWLHGLALLINCKKLQSLAMAGVWLMKGDARIWFLPQGYWAALVGAFLPLLVVQNSYSKSFCSPGVLIHWELIYCLCSVLYVS